MTPEHAGEVDLLSAIAKMERVNSYLEIGVRYGISFAKIGEALPEGSLMVAVDMPGGEWGQEGSAFELNKVANRLRARGHEVHVILGDSTDPEIVAQVQKISDAWMGTDSPPRFGLCYIDGDHRYEGVRADFVNYQAMCRIVAFDDIWTDRFTTTPKGKDPLAGTHHLWEEIKAGRRYVELAGTKKRTQGIGVLWNAK